MKKNIILLLLLCFLIVVPSAPIGESALEKVVLDERTIQDPLKSWSITFTEAVNKGTIKKQNFYIIDAKQKKMKTKLKLSNDGSKVTITPEARYKEGVQYYLYIKGNVKSGSNAFLNEHTILPFKLGSKASADKVTNEKKPGSVGNKPSSGGEASGSGSGNSSSDSAGGSNSNVDKDNKNVLKIEAERHSHFVEISVQVSESVVKVKAGGDELEYKGNNLFTLNKPGLKSGEKLVIQGFSISNKVLETKEIVIP